MRRRLRAIAGRGGEDDPFLTDCENHEGIRATFRVACPGQGVSNLWMLCNRCTEDMLRHVEGAIAAPIGGKR